METAESLLAQTTFIVEATSFEQMVLWKENSTQSREAKPGARNWEQMPYGWLVTVGKIGSRPCCISVSWYKINGQLVMFYYQCSQVTDSKQTEKWLEENFKGRYDNGTRCASTDAQNFGHCLSAIDEANKDPERFKRETESYKPQDHSDVIGKTFRVIKCDAKEHGNNSGCICKFVGKDVTIAKKYSSPFVGTASYHIQGSRKRITRREFGMKDVMN